MRKNILRAGTVVLGLAAATEGVARFSGVTDFPLYDADNHIGYIPKPSQSGAFLRGNDWVFNELSMGTARPFAPDERQDILLIGDSIVFGGNPYRQADKLGPQMEAVSGAAVWPISAGSWGLQNELQYLADHPQVTQAADRIVFVLNAADFGQPSSWRSEATHPRSRPVSAIVYLLRKYLIKPAAPPTPPELAVPARDPIADLRAFADGYGRPIDIWLHADRADFGTPGAPAISAIAGELRGDPGLTAARIHLVHEIPGWSKDLYKDDIHPTPVGLGILARAIVASL